MIHTRMLRSRRRTGFSLIELLVVIGILAILAALVTAGVGRVRSAQQAKATETSMAKIRLAFDRQWKATLDQAREDGRKQPNQSTIPQPIWDWCNGDRDRTTALWAYIKLRQEFPQTFLEAVTPVSIAGYVFPAKATFGSIAAAYAPSPPPAPMTLAEYRLQSAALLYLFMGERGNRGETFSADDVANSDWAVSGKPFRVFKDSWGQPICFERFTTSPDVNKRPYATPFLARTGLSTIDPLDPTYKLADQVHWDPTPPPLDRKTISEGVVMPPVPPGGPTAYTPNGLGFYTFRLDQNRMFTLISFGQDKNIDANPDSGDDIYSYRVHRPGNTNN